MNYKHLSRPRNIFSLSITFVFMLTIMSQARSVADLTLPKEVCVFVGAEDCSKLTESKTHAKYIDLNNDDTKELIFTFEGGSCGSIYWVFELEKMKWNNLGSWCGCEDNIFSVKETQHNGYKDIWTCGFSGFFDGKEYTGYRQ